MEVSFFKKVLSQTLKSIENTLGLKSEEYVRNKDAMHNFNTGAKMTGLIREKVIAGFALKHQISIIDMRNDIENGVIPTEELVNEKFGDAINYLILEKASILERIEQYNSNN